MWNSREYHSWHSMKQRCSNTNADNYKHYGGRGITYDPRWEKFSEFYTDMGDRPSGTSLDRKDNNSPYNKDNCRWATQKEQIENRGRNKNNKLGHKLISVEKKTGKYKIQKRIDGVNTCLGRFISLPEALEVRNKLFDMKDSE